MPHSGLGWDTKEGRGKQVCRALQKENQVNDLRLAADLAFGPDIDGENRDGKKEEKPGKGHGRERGEKLNYSLYRSVIFFSSVLNWFL